MFSRPINDEPIQSLGILLDAKSVAKGKSFKKMQLASNFIRIQVRNLKCKKNINMRKNIF